VQAVFLQRARKAARRFPPSFANMTRSLRPTTRLPSTLLILTIAILLFSSLASCSCFFPDGKLEKNPEYVPCANETSDPLHKICCATNRTPDRGPDICMPNGLCQVGVKKGETPKAVPAFTKPQCVNSNYDEPGCLHVCGVSQLSLIGVEVGLWWCGCVACQSNLHPTLHPDSNKRIEHYTNIPRPTISAT
jgi:hypothetical protein